MGLWARTLDGASGKWVQADRGGRPNQTPFLAGEANAAYLAAEPADDARFVPVGGEFPITLHTHLKEHVSLCLLPNPNPYPP
jgi:hypothetical protein